MNIVLLTAEEIQGDEWKIVSPRQVQHLHQHLNIQVGDTLKVGVRQGSRYLTEVMQVSTTHITVRPIQSESVPEKLPIRLVVALPRPKVLRRLVMDSVTLGVSSLHLIHSYRVDKSYWQSPFLRQLDDYVNLGLEQAGDCIAPEVSLHQRFKPFVEDILPQWISTEQPAFVAHPYAEQNMPQAIEQACSLIIGPEGGFIPYEVDLMQKNGCQARSLGSRILRTETAISYILGRLSF
ncbi:16S rRNA (uracil(1498)-N(3))-methyltransferase [Acinetobacter sp. MD2]|uniref:16S rRNA (uracil(1498)-N(3))-methyltransferase n=1 Tax=Acinetobacter sp. MD2 TaxID=2600066 RepID=UPI002D1E9939|nr:16S rRNA (uracil(1498)-N(3))-methyltransferase [Acinetobacter sp. MD2]MEB3766900.1 16S rRNA (uracil(1498)-N(3))-methyltransferase [Acinetobacter sp. MD2]